MSVHPGLFQLFIQYILLKPVNATGNALQFPINTCDENFENKVMSRCISTHSKQKQSEEILMSPEGFHHPCLEYGECYSDNTRKITFWNMKKANVYLFLSRKEWHRYRIFMDDQLWIVIITIRWRFPTIVPSSIVRKMIFA